MADVLQDLEAYQKFDEMMRVLRSAVREAQEESRRLGVPNVYSFGGQIYYELPQRRVHTHSAIVDGINNE